jgi:hypothetical protein
VRISFTACVAVNLSLASRNSTSLRPIFELKRINCESEKNIVCIELLFIRNLALWVAWSGAVAAALGNRQRRAEPLVAQSSTLASKNVDFLSE